MLFPVSSLLCCFAWIYSASAAPTELSIPYEKYILPNNGLEVILSEDHSLPIVSVNLWYHAGPVNEPPKRSGFAHLFEHLMFQGSQNVGDDMHIRLLLSRGASSLNGTTGYDRTNYFETVPQHELEMALWLESDRMGFLLEAMDQNKLDNQREVVLNERRQHYDNAPYGKSHETLVQTLLKPTHPYYGVVIGSMDDLKAATLADVRDFYINYYAPANATLVICGDFNPNVAKEWVNRYFGSLARRDAPKSNPIEFEPIQEERIVHVQEAVSLPKIAMLYHSPAAFMPGDADADILANILGHGISSRLYQRLVYKQATAVSVSAEQDSLALGSFFNIEVMAKPHTDMQKLKAEIQSIIDELIKTPPSVEEVQRARNLLLTHLISGLQHIGGFGGKADILNRYNQYLSNPGYFTQDIARYQAVTPETVHKIAQHIFANNRRAVVITVPK
jgi:zinc protease